MTLSSRLDELERLAKAATPGPWTHSKLTPDKHSSEDVSYIYGDTYRDGVNMMRIGVCDGYATAPERASNAAYIATANPSAILALIGEVRELLKEKTNA